MLFGYSILLTTQISYVWVFFAGFVIVFSYFELSHQGTGHSLSRRVGIEDVYNNERLWTGLFATLNDRARLW